VCSVIPSVARESVLNAGGSTGGKRGEPRKGTHPSHTTDPRAARRRQ
jgi:hypothetical protein